MRIKTFVLTLIICVLLHSNAFALSENTHPYLNEKIARGTYNEFSLDTYLKSNLGYADGVNDIIKDNKRVWEYISIGGYKEDIPYPWAPYIRSIKHFHDPLVEDWNSAGFKGANSSIIWAETENQSSLLGNYSWPDVRNYFYNALTATNFNDRDTNYAECFRGIGQLMHLVQDVSVPEHVRNDLHVWYSYEKLVSKLQPTGELFGMFPSPTLKVDYTLLNRTGYNPAATIPIAGLFDADQYGGTNPGITTTAPVGLAEYTNANFFSRDTVDGDYPYPSLSNCQKGDVVWVDDPRNPGNQVRRKYYTKTSGGETGYKLATLSYEWMWGGQYMPAENAWLTVRDDNVYRDYAAKLIPKAVKYSAGLLNYFFRGQVDAVDAATTKNGNGDVTGVNMKVRNETPKVGGITGEIEPIGGGTDDKLVVSYQYTSGGSTLYGKSSPLAFDNYSGHTYEFTGFTQPIPADATDKKYMLVYRGKLGAEEDAVAAKSLMPGVIIDDFDDSPVSWTVDDSHGKPSCVLTIDTAVNVEGTGSLRLAPYNDISHSGISGYSVHLGWAWIKGGGQDFQNQHDGGFTCTSLAGKRCTIQSVKISGFGVQGYVEYGCVNFISFNDVTAPLTIYKNPVYGGTGCGGDQGGYQNIVSYGEAIWSGSVTIPGAGSMPGTASDVVINLGGLVLDGRQNELIFVFSLAPQDTIALTNGGDGFNLEYVGTYSFYPSPHIQCNESELNVANPWGVFHAGHEFAFADDNPSPAQIHRTFNNIDLTGETMLKYHAKTTFNNISMNLKFTNSNGYTFEHTFTPNGDWTEYTWDITEIPDVNKDSINRADITATFNSPIDSGQALWLDIMEAHPNENN